MKKKIYFLYLCVLYFCIGSIQAAPINTFPYVNYLNSAESLKDWRLHNAILSKDFDSDIVGEPGTSPYGYYLMFDSQNSGYAITPEFDLSSLNNPCLLIECFNSGLPRCTVEVSTDGNLFSPLGQSSMLLLPKGTKYIRISSPAVLGWNMGLCRIEIRESSPINVNVLPYEIDAQNLSKLAGWSGSKNSFTFMENVKPGAMWIIPSGLYLQSEGILVSPELNLSQFKNIYLSVEGLDSSFPGDKLTNIRISGSTDGIHFVNLPVINNQTVIPNNIRRIKIENTASSVSPAKIIKRLVFASVEDENFIGASVSLPDAEYFYDVDGDGIKEFFKPAVRTISYNNYAADLISYSVFSNGKVFPKDTVVSNFIGSTYSILNINNDGIPDFGWEYDRFDKKPHGVYISSPDGYKLMSGVEPRQWDVNSDGRPDLYSLQKSGNKQSWFIHQQNADGTFTKMAIDTVSYASLNDSTRYRNWDMPQNTGIFDPSGLGSLLDGFVFEKGASTVSFDNLELEIDLNKDGLPDLVDTRVGGVFYNMGSNKYVPGSFKGQIIAKDLNGDFISDFIVYDSDKKTVKTMIYKGGGEIEEKLLFSNMVLSNVYCYDFNKDGHVDILLTFDYTAQSGYSFLVFMENNGDGTFKKHEKAYPEHFSFKLCADIDNDGYYDIIAIKSISSSYWESDEIFLLKGQAGFKFSAPEVIAKTPYKSYNNSIGSLQLIDIDNNGRLELIISNSNSSAVTRFDDVTPNTAPERLQAPQYVLDKVNGKLKVSWQRGNDKESSPADLTYALRIGSQPGMGDIYYANANADGGRRNFKPGNMGHNLDKLLNVNGWAPGTYYIAVQAVDPQFKGSAWSPETVYTHVPASVEFNVSRAYLSTSDTLTIALAGAVLPSYSYNWNLSGGRIVGQNTAGSIMDVVFDKAGDTTISLQVQDPEGNFMPLCEQQVSVFANKFELHDFKGILIYSFLDLNGDGIYDAMGNYGLLQNDGKGNFSKIPKIFNADLSVGEPSFIDFNMDGLPDMVGYSNKGNLLINEGDFDFDIRTESFTIDGESKDEFRYELIDLNNDGFLDCWTYSRHKSYRMCKNSGDNKTFVSIDNFNDNFSLNSLPYFTDLNKDGLVDMIKYSPGFPKYFNEVQIWLNKGDFEFEEKTVKLSDEGFYMPILGDFNSDGYIDLVLSKNPWTLVVYPGDASYSFSQQIEIPLPKEISDSYLDNQKIVARDYDNNGYPDIVLRLVDKQHQILYFYPDWEVKLQPIENAEYLSKGGWPFVDMNGDGSPDAFSNRIACNMTKVTNTPPSVPGNVRANVRGNKLLIEWDPAFDKETPLTQMRYNISVKKKGAKGDNSFVISPMNGLSNAGSIIPDKYYPSATRMEVPISRLIPGVEYEIQIQSIDLWNVASPMSEAVVFRSDDILLETVSETCAQLETEVKLLRGAESGSAIWDWDGATILEGSGDGPYRMEWNTPGMKTIKATIGSKTAMAQIKVNEAIDIAFSLPSVVPGATEIAFELPEILLNPEIIYSFETSRKDIKITRRSGTREAKIVFPTKGDNQLVTLSVKTVCGEMQYEQIVDVKDGLAVPQVSIVTIDDQTGRNKIIWDKTNSRLDETVTMMNIYKEGSRYNQFYLIGEVDPKAGEFIDLSSNPQITTARYKIAYQTSYGVTSTLSNAHRSTHLLLNKGAVGNSINLMWSAYEGGVIDSYRIYRGLTPESMQLLTEVSGSSNSYTDLTPPEGVFYYTLEYDKLYETQWNWENGTSTRSSSDSPVLLTSGSNIVSVVNAQNITLSQSIKIMALETAIELEPQQIQLHLYTEVFPIIADYKMVNWTIVAGESLASINRAGLLTATGKANGTVIVRATAVDGSGVYAELMVPIKDFPLLSIESPTDDDKSMYLLLYPNPAVNDLYVKNINASVANEAKLSLYDLNGRLYLTKKVTDSETYLSVESLTSGVYIVHITSKQGSQYCRFIKK